MKFGKNTVFKNLSADFSEGISMVLGSNGSGKSTLLRIMAGLQNPTDGECKLFDLDGEISHDENVLGKIFLCSPDIELYADLTLWDNLKLFSGLMSSKIPDLSEWNLQKFKNKKYGELSSGYKQRAKLIVAFMGKSPILLLDEPEQHLDEIGISKLTEKIEEREGLGLTTIIATNHPWRKWNVVIKL